MATRIAPGALLDHPKRARLLELVRARGGVHMRELHREIGGGWGAFAFHLRLLERSGRVRRAREGAYAVILPPEGARGAPLLAHAVARAVYAAIPADGREIGLGEVIARIGRARNVVAYHVNALARRGLVEKRARAAGRCAIARAPLGPLR